MDPVANLHRRFGLLFTLPGTVTALLMTLVASTVPIVTIYFLARGHLASAWLPLIAVFSLLVMNWQLYYFRFNGTEWMGN